MKKPKIKTYFEKIDRRLKQLLFLGSIILIANLLVLIFFMIR